MSYLEQAFNEDSAYPKTMTSGNTAATTSVLLLEALKEKIDIIV
jgi:hypothetical protein